MILSGKVEILSGRDEVRVEYGAFQHLGEGCLKVAEGTWKPDFSAYVIGDDARVVRIPCSEFFAAIKEANTATTTATATSSSTTTTTAIALEHKSEEIV
jgi:hypothetical protein